MSALDPLELGLLAGGFLLLVGVALVAFVRRRRRVARSFADPELLRRLVGADLQEIPWRRLVPAAVAACALALALVAASSAAPASVPRGPVVLLLDASGSMLVDDVGARRLDAQRAFAEALVDELGDVPVGIVAFSGRAFSLTPPTRDGGAIRMYLASIDPTIVTQSGSAVGAAIRQGIALLGGGGDGEGGTLVLVGDGDETEDREGALAAARLVGRGGLRLHSVAVGTRSGGPVPALDLSTGAVQGLLRNESGEIVLSQLQDGFLRELSDLGGGIQVETTDPTAVSRLAREIQGGARRTEGSVAGVPTHVWLAFAAFLLLLVEPLGTSPGRPE